MGRTYAEIAVQIGYKHDYIKQVGSQLWRELSQVVGEEVCKKISNLFCVATSSLKVVINKDRCLRPATPTQLGVTKPS
ncbi:hypothetical protein LC609_18180 [Nostoc sp. XA013]|nr:hypothetical protein [Nostoc sp. XA013]